VAAHRRRKELVAGSLAPREHHFRDITRRCLSPQNLYVTRTNASRALLILLVFGSTAAKAQISDRQRADSLLRRALADIASQDPRTVRVATGATGRLEGNQVSLLGDSVLMSTESGTRSIAITDVDSVWTHRGTAALLVGIITGFPCAVLGATIGGFIGGDPDSKGTPRREAIFTIVGLAGGALVCGGVGALVGSSFDRWRLEYARPVATM
jgi:hypothetical protein